MWKLYWHILPLSGITYAKLFTLQTPFQDSTSLRDSTQKYDSIPYFRMCPISETACRTSKYIPEMHCILVNGSLICKFWDLIPVDIAKLLAKVTSRVGVCVCTEGGAYAASASPGIMIRLA